MMRQYTPIALVALVLGLSVLSESAVKCPDECHKCTKRELTCRSNKINETFIMNLPKILTPDIVNISIRGGNIPELPPNMFGNCSGDSSKVLLNLKHLSLRGNQISTIHGRTFHCVPNLLTLDLSVNNWMGGGLKHSATFAQLTKLEELDLTDALKDKIPGKHHVRRLSWLFTNSKLEKLRKLHLGRNDLFVFTNEAAQSLCTMPNLEWLDLRENQLGKITFHPCKALNHLYHVDLTNNTFDTVDKETLEAFDKQFVMQRKDLEDYRLSIDFRRNQWVCDCHLRKFVKWMKSTDVTLKFAKDMTCHDGKYLGQSLMKINEDKLVCETVAPSNPSKAGVVVLTVLFVIIGCVVIVVIFIKRNSLKNFYKVNIAEPFRRGYFAKTGSYSYSSVDNANV